MRIKYHIMLILCLLILCCSGILFTAYGAEVGEQRVFDDAGLLSADEIRQLEEQVAGLRKKMKMDVVLVTTSDAIGKNSQDYADEYYEDGGFGNGKSASGVLFLIDIDNREIYISSSGVMIRILTDKRINKMLDRGMAYMKEKDYSGVMQQFLKDVEQYYRAGIPGGQYNYDIETGMVSRYRSIRWYEALAAIAVSGFCGFGTCMGVARSYEMKKERKQGTAALQTYRSTADFVMGMVTDDLVDKALIHQRIDTRSTGSTSHGSRSTSSSGRSSTHRSSSGRTHGGGGRKF